MLLHNYCQKTYRFAIERFHAMWKFRVKINAVTLYLHIGFIIIFEFNFNLYLFIHQNINYHDAFLALEQEGWVTLLNSGWQDRLGYGELAVNTPIVVDTSDTHIKQYWVIWLHRHWYAEHRLAEVKKGIINPMYPFPDE